MCFRRLRNLSALQAAGPARASSILTCAYCDAWAVSGFGRILVLRYAVRTRVTGQKYLLAAGGAMRRWFLRLAAADALRRWLRNRAGGFEPGMRLAFRLRAGHVLAGKALCE